VVTGRVYGISPLQGLFRLPSTAWQALPMLLQVLFLMAAVVLQFVATFWFLSKGGVDVYFPDDVKTRFSDVEANRFEVLTVSHALETHRTVSGEDVMAIIEGERGPLIDGRPYHQAEFMALAEEYHQRAVAAHEGHSKVELPLPVWATDGQALRLEPAIEKSKAED